MKSTTRFVIYIVIVAALLFLFLWSPGYIERTGKNLVEKLDYARDLALSGDWDNSHHIMQSIEKDWHEMKDTWDALLPASYVYSLDELIAHSASYSKYGNENEFFPAIDKLKHLIKHAKDFESTDIKIL